MRSDEKQLEKLIKAIADGDNSAFGEFYTMTDRAVFGYALSILKNTHDAEDIMQETYIRIRSSAHMYESQNKAFAWIFTIVRNLCYMKLRTNKDWLFNSLEDYEHLQSEHNETEVEDKLVLKSLLRILNEQERQIVTLHAMTGMKHREIAQIMELPLPTVLTKYARAIAKMKKEIKADSR